jgi:hypothetical protein
VDEAEDGDAKERLLRLERPLTQLRAAHRALFSGP